MAFRSYMFCILGYGDGGVDFVLGICRQCTSLWDKIAISEPVEMYSSERSERTRYHTMV